MKQHGFVHGVEALELFFPTQCNVSSTVLIRLCSLPAGDGERSGNPMRASVRGEKVPHVGDIHAAVVDRALPLLRTPIAYLPLRVPNPEAPRPAPGHCRPVGDGGAVAHSSPFQLCVPVPAPALPAEPAQDGGHRVGLADCSAGASVIELGVRVSASAWCGSDLCYFECFLVDFGSGVVWVHCFWRVPGYVDWILHGGVFGSLGVCEVVCCVWSHAVVPLSLSLSKVYLLILSDNEIMIY